MNDRRRAVEHGLQAALRFEGREPERFTVTERMARYAVPGMAIVVVDGGEITWAGGYGTRGPDGGAMTPDTLVQVASISKAIAAVGVLALVEAGDLDLDADVNSALRSWHLDDSVHTAEQPVTLRHLLSHTAGTTVPGFPGYPQGAPVPTVPQLLSGEAPAVSPKVESFAPPGTTYQYSGGGTTIVQQLVCDVTGRDYGELMADLVLRPLGMVDSAFEQPFPADRLGRAASGHDAGGQPVAGGSHVYPELQAAGLWSTAADLARWVMGIQRILGGDAGGPISPDTARLMVTHVGPGPFGLGPELGGEGALRRFGHNGANEGFKSQVDGLVERATGAAIVTNGENGTTLAAEVRRAVADVFGWGEIDTRAIRLADLPEGVLRSYTGRYAGPFGRPMKLVFDGGELYSPAPYGRRRMLPLGPTTFLDEETGATLEVEAHEGRVVRIAVLVDGTELMAFDPLEDE